MVRKGIRRFVQKGINEGHGRGLAWMVVAVDDTVLVESGFLLGDLVLINLVCVGSSESEELLFSLDDSVLLLDESELSLDSVLDESALSLDDTVLDESALSLDDTELLDEVVSLLGDWVLLESGLAASDSMVSKPCWLMSHCWERLLRALKSGNGTISSS